MDEPTDPQARRTPRWRRFGRGAAFLAGAVVASLVTTTVAQGGVSQSFNDVPPSHPFYGAIEKVADACIAGGYADGTYRPADPVTRQAMAAFLARAGSTVVEGGSVGETFPNFGSASASTYSAYVDVATVTVTIPDLPGNCSVPVLLLGQAAVFSNASLASTCHGTPCNVEAWLWDETSYVGDAPAWGRLASDSDGFGLSAQTVLTQPDGTTHTYRLRVRGFNVQDGMGTVSNDRTMSAVVLPFAAAGTV